MVERLEFATRDPERAIPVLSEFFPAVRMSNPHGNFSFEMASASAESFELIHYHLLSPRSISSVDTTGTLTVGVVNAGHVALTADRRLIDTSRPWLFPQEPVVGEWDEITVTALSVSTADVLGFARNQLGDDAFSLRFTDLSPIDEARGRQWAAFVEYTRVALSEESSLLRSSLVQANAFSHLASMLLATFPNTFADVAKNQSTQRALPQTVRRAIQYIDDNAHTPITLEDIARESRLSIRGLQYAFRSSLDTTPTAYLRSARLAGAHESLVLADPTTGVTVVDIATLWGFQHAGRFASQYRQAYGESPRRTLES